jgi:NTP pyrophosphatase (non-canonical NTP hydrolase)
MNLNQLQSFAKEENARLKAHYKLDDKERFLLAQTVKLTEETGELADAVLAKLKLQSKWKLANTKPSVEEEIADVILTTSVLAASLGVDLDAAVEKKIAELKSRRTE